MKRLLLLTLPLLALLWRPAAAQTPPEPTCGLGAAIAFCDSFNQPMGIGSRAGQLNGTVWGVSRQTGDQGFSAPAFGWAASINDNCGNPITVQPDNDWVVCNGRAVDSLDDLGTIPNNAAYPKQPFDFAGRTGRAVFDVTNDTGGTHAAWPEFWITNLPVPAPFDPTEANSDQSAYWDNAQYAIGVQLAGECGPHDGGNCGCHADNPTAVQGVSEVTVINNYQATQLFPQPLDCATASSGPNGPLNHYEIDISQSQLDVYSTDAGGSVLHHLISQPVSLGFTRGFIWLNDVHYNGDKFCSEGGACQRVHSFAWANVGFDGPVLPRDLSYDVLDALTPAGTDPVNDGVTNASLPIFNLGWEVWQGHAATLQTMPVPASAIANAAGCVLTFNAYEQQAVSHFLIGLNGHAYTFAPPAGTLTYAEPVSCADTVPGSNNITIQTDSVAIGANVANVDLKFLAAGGVPSCLDPSDCPQPGPSPTPSPTPAPGGAGITCPSSTFRVTIVSATTISASCS